MKKWPHVEDDVETKIGWRTLVRKVFLQPDGKSAEYYTKDRVGSRAGAVIALTADNHVVVAEQFRPGPEKILQDLPGGGINPDEDAQDAVLRELKEETGYVATGDVVYLGEVLKDAYTNTTWHFYLAKECIDSGERKLDEGEFVDVRLITIDQLLINARTAMMTDTEAVLLAYETLMSIKGRK
ncbi:TPA: NUDIX hydrolase [Candidatus Saccharibacteria bacterium]|nr:MAG: ADP-ribose pyrophosphatase [Candidatus Saccharibacteria bacterium GW2011_GWC2_44_17]MBH1956176.1 NUDIX hydrolase [Candidatus Saccharibacteria bacterium]OGL33245.1 MAG: hypothetical protein A3E20_01395 [Candidatus Saccharibacteria bacterium RIFCSPHIGHO2_12_FULL_47_16]MBH1972564.1 NUDIX hydrolase [Candidatus Saccharibacteria bacterium]MBH1990766.1 NUDIX hydrolase [Candidatus Saccharibacteria bacterium]